MTASVTVFLGLILSLAALLLLYAANLRFIAREGRWSWLNVVPVVTPVRAWRAGARGLPTAMVLSAIAYCLFWVSAGIGAA
jgi:hypothetical protein